MSSVLSLDAFNTLDKASASATINQWLACRWWVEQLGKHRPYAALAELRAAADEFWRQTTPAQQREAFAAHPLIGDVETLQPEFGTADAKTDAAQREQGQVLGANPETLTQLAARNRDYLERHGFIFIICASGLSAETMLAALERRLPNDTAVELMHAAIEQEQIMQLRLTATITPGSSPA